MFLRRLLYVLEDFGILSDEMSAYRPLRSPQDNILDLCVDIEECKKTGGHVTAVFFDVSGAYNKLKHDVIEELFDTVRMSRDSGFRRAIMSLLTDRSIVLSCGTEKTKPHTLENRGVSQGGVLSPIIFAACTARLRRHIPPGVMLSQFSDDGAIWMKCKGRKLSPMQVCILQKTIGDIANELRVMGLSIEPSKTLCCAFNARDSKSLVMRLDGDVIKCERTVKFLGLILQSNGKWNEQVDKLCYKAEKVNSLVKNMCGRHWGVHPVTALMIVKSLLISSIDYVLPYMTDLTQEQQRKLSSALAEPLRGALGVLPMTKLDNVYAEAGVVPIELRGRYQLELLILRLYRMNHSLLEKVATRCKQTVAADILMEWQLEMSGVDAPEKHVLELSRTNICGVDGLRGDEGVVCVMVDGAQKGECGGAAAVCAADGTQLVETLAQCSASTTAEVAAIKLAMQHVKDHHTESKGAVIMSDSQAAINEICRPHPSNDNFNAAQAIHELSLECALPIELRWVKKNCDEPSLALVDTLAKTARQKEDAPRQVLRPVYSELKRRVRSRVMGRWREKYEAGNSGGRRAMMGLGVLERPVRVPGNRRDAVTCYRIRCGKVMTRSTMRQLGFSRDDCCSQCGVVEDLWHVLEHCRRFDAERREWRQMVEWREEDSCLRTRMMEKHGWLLAKFVNECNLVL